MKYWIRLWLFLLFAFVLNCLDQGEIHTILDLSGPTGPAGETGLPGLNGSRGESGETGVSGQIGSAGTAGQTGSTGSINACPRPQIRDVNTNGSDFRAGEVYPIHLIYNGSTPVDTASISGFGGYFTWLNNSLFNFEPSVAGGPYSFVATAENDCGLDSQPFTINYIKPGWPLVGKNSLPSSWSDFFSFFVDQGTPYIAFTHGNSQLSVRKFTGSEWVDISEGLPENNVDLPALYVDRATPYLGFRVTADKKGKVMFYNGIRWQTAGNSQYCSEDKIVSSPSLFVYNGTPYFAFIANENGSLNYGNGSVVWLNGGVWEYFAPPTTWGGFINSIAFYISDGTPYAAFNGSATQCVHSYTNQWGFVPDIECEQNRSSLSLFVDHNSIYLGYLSQTGNNAFHLYKKVIGEDLQDIIPDNLSGNLISVAIDDHSPYIAYSDGETITVRTDKYRTLGFPWQVLGQPISNVNANYLFLFVSQGTPYIGYLDVSVWENKLVQVRKYVTDE